MSEKEFLSGPETRDHAELIDGEVIVSRSPTVLHQRLVGTLYRALEAWAEQHSPAWVGLSPLDLKLAPGRIVQPDLFLVIGRAPPQRTPVDEVPELIIEVVSDNRAYDRLTKKLLYAEAGVEEYWLVDPTSKTVEVFAALKQLSSSKSSATSRVASGLAIDLKKLFGR